MEVSASCVVFAGRSECGGLPEDGMCQPHSSHQKLLQGAVDKVDI